MSLRPRDCSLEFSSDGCMRKVVGIVDDDPGVLSSVGRFLRVAGYGTELYSSAEDLLGRVETTEATCLVLDIHLGGISGIELARQLVKRGCTAPVIFISGAANQSMERAAIESGCIALLHKPFCAKVLVDAVESAFQPAGLKARAAAVLNVAPQLQGSRSIRSAATRHLRRLRRSHSTLAHSTLV
jgi:FixJ family two-component response regulator